MQTILRCAAVVVTLGSVPASAGNDSLERVVVGMAAEATALSEFCVNWAIDSVAVRQFLRSRRVSVDGRYRAIFGAAYARAHEKAWRNGNYPAACDNALDLYGPQGREVAGLVRPVWNGACGDCQRPDALVGY
jgi:hypothetical protein